MARSRRRSRPTISLFPFLSVLACVIGSLTLLITATAIGQIATDAVDVEHYERLEAQIADARRRIAELSALSEEVAGLGEGLEAEEAAWAGLSEESERTQAAARRSAALRAQLAEAEERVAAFERELDPIGREARARRAALDERRAARAAAPILVQPSGSGLDVDAHFVECSRDGLVLFEGPERRPTSIPAHRVASSGDLYRFLRFARLRSKGTVVFLIRPGGVPVCDRAAEQAVRAEARFGKVPLPGDGPLDFSPMDAS